MINGLEYEFKHIETKFGYDGVSIKNQIKINIEKVIFKTVTKLYCTQSVFTALD